MRILAGPNTNALRSITGYNAGSPLRKMPAMTQGQAGSAAAGAAALGSDIGAIASDNIPAQSAKGEGGRILGETAKYAGMGMAFGPIGAGVGALVGLTVGIIKNNKAKEAHKEQIADNDKANKANAAQLALAANVNSQKAPATMKSPNERNMAPNKRTEPLKRTMAPLKMAPLKRELSSMQANSSYMRTPASDVKRQEIMRTVSGSSSLKTTRVTEKGDLVIKKDGQEYFLSQSNNKTEFEKQYEEAKFKQDKKADNEAKVEFAKNNPKLAETVSAENLKTKTPEEKKEIIQNYRRAQQNSNTQIAENK